MVHVKPLEKLNYLWAKGAVIWRLLRSEEFMVITIRGGHLSQLGVHHDVATNANIIHMAAACAGLAKELPDTAEFGNELIKRALAAAADMTAEKEEHGTN